MCSAQSVSDYNNGLGSNQDLDDYDKKIVFRHISFMIAFKLNNVGIFNNKFLPSIRSLFA